MSDPKYSRSDYLNALNEIDTLRADLAKAQSEVSRLHGMWDEERENDRISRAREMKSQARVAELSSLLEGVQRTLEHTIARHRPIAPAPFKALPCELCVERLNEVKAALASDGNEALAAVRLAQTEILKADKRMLEFMLHQTFEEPHSPPQPGCVWCMNVDVVSALTATRLALHKAFGAPKNEH